jgi:hypothetical protein
MLAARRQSTSVRHTQQVEPGAISDQEMHAMAVIESDSNYRDRICPENLPTLSGGTALRTASAFLLMFAPLIAQAGELPDPVFIDSFESGCGHLELAESFVAGDASLWPASWVELANSADVADQLDGDGRLRPVVNGYSLARMANPVVTHNVDIVFTLVMEDATSQGVGFYVRQNGGHLHLTVPSGQGYAVFVEGTFRGMPGIGLWRELDGNEFQLAHSDAAVPVPQADIRYRVHFRVYQVDSTSTRLQGKIWPEADPEPAAWQVELLDMTPALQGISGGIAVDSWNVATPPAVVAAHTRVDDIEVRSLCPAGVTP